MTRPRRKPAVPNLVIVICTDRGQADHGERGNRLTEYQWYADGGNLRFRWVPRGKAGKVPVSGKRRGPGGWHTLTPGPCGICGRDPKIHEERFGPVVRELMARQGTSGERPVIVDISAVEQAL